MDVRMPDGTVLRGVPDGATREQIVHKLQSNGVPVPQEWLTQPPSKPQKTRDQLRTEIDAYEKNRWSVGGRAERMALTEGADLLRNIGRLGKNVSQGALSLPAMILDAPSMLYNAGSDLAGSDSRLRMPFTEAVQSLNSDVLAPRNATERFEDRITQGVSGAMTGVGVGGALSGAASPVVSGVGRTMALNPGAQALAAATGASSAQMAQEMGAGPVGQAVAGLAGGLAPTAIQAGTRGVLRGGEQGRQRVNRRHGDPVRWRRFSAGHQVLLA
jgi:hypothetical protein